MVHPRSALRRGFTLRPAGFAVLWSACAACSVSLSAAEVELKPRLYTDGPGVRKAFADAVTQVRQSTVEVRVNGKAKALGTIVSSDGWIVTKASELRGGLVCHLADGRDLPAKLVSTNEKNDLALVKVDAEGLTPVDFETTGDPSIGQWVATAGTQSLPAAIGVVSTPRRTIPYQRVSGVLGIQVEQRDGPATIREVYEDSAAEKAGLKPGDVLKQLNGQTVGAGASFVNEVRKLNPGDEVDLDITRDGEKLSFTIKLTSPDYGPFLTRVAEQNLMGGQLSPRRTGFDAVIQHDSVLKPYECGGPVVTLTGRAFGINVARAGRTESYALPADVLLPLIEQMKAEATSTTSTTAE